MDALTKALSLIEIGCWVFPATVTDAGEKLPLPKRGHLEASNDPEVVGQWFQDEYPGAHVGVHAGRSGLVLLDRDIKRDKSGEVTKDGFKSLQDSWNVAPATVSYTSVRGEGQHDIYTAPANVVLNGQSNYRKWPGVDRRGGSSWWVWAGDTVPSNRGEFAPAPDWLCDPAEMRTEDGFEGSVEEWVDALVDGDPSILVSNALARVNNDMAHSEMLSAQYNAVRLGAEGNPGVVQLLNKLHEAWMNRPVENHGTVYSQWDFKFEQALQSGIRKYGASVTAIANLPAFSISDLPPGVTPGLLTGSPQNKYHLNKVLNELARSGASEDVQASVLWNAPTTKDLARSWGIDFLYERISSAKIVPEPERENPALEAKSEKGVQGFVELLTAEERAYIAKRPTFVDHYMEAAKESGIENSVYTRAGAWNVSSMAFAFKGFIRQGSDKIMGTNLWNISLGPSGSGKTTVMEFEEAVLDTLFEKDSEDEETAPYMTGSDTSPQGLHLHLLQRDRKPTIMIQDEASIFFDAMVNSKYIDELTRTTADFYNGKVRASSKISLKDFRGKTAVTSFHIAMKGTPGDLLALTTDKMFQSGFLAHMTWDLAPPLTEAEQDKRFEKRQYEGGEELELGGASSIVRGLATDLVSAYRLTGGTPKEVRADQASLKRMEVAHRKMFQNIKGHHKFNILDPSVTRLGEDTLRKCAMICALYRGDTKIRIDDTLHAVAAVEIWFNYLLEVADRVAQGEFQNLCNDIEFAVMQRGPITDTRLLDNFKNRIVKSPKELEIAIDFLVKSGRINKDEVAGVAPKYTINGGN